jgi:predicted ATPase
MVGREAELRQLHHRWQRACDGQRQLVFVTGEPGIGKTTLVDAFAAEVATLEGVWLARGQGVEHYGAEPNGAGEPYRFVLEALGQLCRTPAGLQVRDVLRQCAPMWLMQMPQFLTDDEQEALQGKVVGARPERMLRELAEALDVLTMETPLLLILEDLHWSDHATVELLDVLARRREPARLLVVGTYRPGEVHGKNHPLLGVTQELLPHGDCLELPLSCLSEEAIEEYLAARFPHHAMATELAPRLHRRTEGNPLFLVAVIKQICHVDQADQPATEVTWNRPEMVEDILRSVPDTLQQMIERQFTQLPAEERLVLEMGSVVGDMFTTAAVAAGLGVEVEQVEAWCKELLRKRFFLAARGTEEWPDGTVAERCCFIHTLYREVIYHQIPLAQRMRFHQRVSMRLEQGYGERAGELAVQLAMHCELGRDDWRAVRYRRQAAQNALRLYAYQEAIAHLTRGQERLDALPDTPERKQQELALQLALGPALLATRGYGAPEVQHAYARARELCRLERPTPQLFPALFGLSAFYLARAEYQTARELGEEILALGKQAGDQALLLEAHQLLAAIFWHRGEFPHAQQHLEDSYVLYDHQHHHTHTMLYGQNPEVIGLSYMALTWWVCGFPGLALQRSHEALSLAHKLDHPYDLAFAHSLAAILESFRRQVEMVRAHAEAVISLSRAQGFAYWEAHGTVLRGWALTHQKPAQGIDEMHQGMAAWRKTGARIAVPLYLTLLAEGCAKAGQVNEALRLTSEALDVASRTEDRCCEAELHRLQGELLLAQAATNQRQAESCFRQALTIARQQQAKSWELRAAISLYRLWQQQGKRAPAHQLLAEVYRWFMEGFDTPDLQEARALLEA